MFRKPLTANTLYTDQSLRSDLFSHMVSCNFSFTSHVSVFHSWSCYCWWLLFPLFCIFIVHELAPLTIINNDGRFMERHRAMNMLFIKTIWSFRIGNFDVERKNEQLSPVIAQVRVIISFRIVSIKVNFEMETKTTHMDSFDEIWLIYLCKWFDVVGPTPHGIWFIWYLYCHLFFVNQ